MGGGAFRSLRHCYYAVRIAIFGPARRAAAARLERPAVGAGAALAAVLFGIPTGIIRMPFYHRMTPVTW